MGLTLMAEAAQRIAATGDLERTIGYLARLGEISQQALKEMRLLVYELRPLALEEISLTEALATTPRCRRKACGCRGATGGR